MNGAMDNQRPPQFEWIPIGEYNGIDLPDTFVDNSYTVWILVKNPEYDCEFSPN